MAADFKAQIRIIALPNSFAAGEIHTCTVAVKNVGCRAWPAAGPNPVFLCYHWQTGDRAHFLVYDGHRTPLPADLQPGEEVVLKAAVEPPPTVGQHVLEFDLVQELVAWFKDHGSETAWAVCPVTGRRAQSFQDFDYEALWSRADLDRDYWSIVGPGSKEEFEVLGKGKHLFLVSLGLQPHSRVLDVGCGTGLLTLPLLFYLGPEGLYYGTDIGKEAVEFCRRKFSRPNFFFVQNSMTRIPIEGVRFDFIFLGSVFTHMYPDEVRDMLIDLRRLLDDRGMIIADAFATSGVERYRGGRGMIEINEGVLLRAFAAAGVNHQLLERYTWNADTERMIFKLTHAAAGTAGQQAA